MNRENFINILMNNDPEELSNFLKEKGKIKIVSAIRFMDDLELNRSISKYAREKIKKKKEK